MTPEARDEIFSWVCVIGLVSAFAYVVPRIPKAPGAPWPVQQQADAYLAAANVHCRFDSSFEAPAADRCSDTQWLVRTGDYSCEVALEILDRGCS